LTRGVNRRCAANDVIVNAILRIIREFFGIWTENSWSVRLVVAKQGRGHLAIGAERCVEMVATKSRVICDDRAAIES
jgi:hypothetical protein